MRRLTDEQRCALREVGPPGEGPIPDEVFRELAELGYGRWVTDDSVHWLVRWAAPRVWEVTPSGHLALYYDTLARGEKWT
jgi:hypothetical protein